MGINIRTKGAEGEREVAKILNAIIQDVMRAMEFPPDEIIAAGAAVQRNQNQSAVGGNDLSNTFGMSIEVKRQEQLAVNTWWQQCVDAAGRNAELPVLMYRQNGKKWKVRTYGWLPYFSDGKWDYERYIVEFDIEQFKTWFAQWVRGKLEAGERVKK